MCEQNRSLSWEVPNERVQAFKNCCWTKTQWAAAYVLQWDASSHIGAALDSKQAQTSTNDMKRVILCPFQSFWHRGKQGSKAHGRLREDKQQSLQYTVSGMRQRRLLISKAFLKGVWILGHYVTSDNSSFFKISLHWSNVRKIQVDTAAWQEQQNGWTVENWLKGKRAR